MKRLCFSVAFTLTIGVLFLTTGLQAAPIIGGSSGTFENPIGPGVPSDVTGVGTNFFTWGDGSAFGSPSSSLGFAGTAFSTFTETVFSFGTLTFFNGTIAEATQADSVDLEVTLSLTTPAGVNQEFTYLMQLINTLNTSDPNASADIINFPNFFPDQTFNVNDTLHTLKLIGFGAVSGGGFTTISSFNVLEGQSASADLLGKVTVETNEVIPEPSTYLLFGIGILSIIGMSYRRRKKAA